MICTALSSKDFEMTQKLALQCELAEIRIDLSEFNKEQVKTLFSLHKNLVATCRPGKYSEIERKELLTIAIKNGAKYVDIEIESDDVFKKELITLAHAHNSWVIISYHNFELTPTREELENIVLQCFTQGADVAKIATMIQKPSDNADILSLFKQGKRIVAIGMGQLGKITRVAAPMLGAEFTFAASSDGQVTAPGQVSDVELRKIIELIK
jgi:3-dehydroquinate dehydratase I